MQLYVLFYAFFFRGKNMGKNRFWKINGGKKISNPSIFVCSSMCLFNISHFSLKKKKTANLFLSQCFPCPPGLPRYKKVNHRHLSICRRITTSIHSPSECILCMNTISVQLCGWFIIYIVYLYSSATSLSVYCRQTSLPLMGNVDKDGLGHLSRLLKSNILGVGVS